MPEHTGHVTGCLFILIEKGPPLPLLPPKGMKLSKVDHYNTRKARTRYEIKEYII